MDGGKKSLSRGEKGKRACGKKKNREAALGPRHSHHPKEKRGNGDYSRGAVPIYGNGGFEKGEVGWRKVAFQKTENEGKSSVGAGLETKNFLTPEVSLNFAGRTPASRPFKARRGTKLLINLEGEMKSLFGGS